MRDGVRIHPLSPKKSPCRPATTPAENSSSPRARRGGRAAAARRRRGSRRWDRAAPVADLAAVGAPERREDQPAVVREPAAAAAEDLGVRQSPPCPAAGIEGRRDHQRRLARARLRHQLLREQHELAPAPRHGPPERRRERVVGQLRPVPLDGSKTRSGDRPPSSDPAYAMTSAGRDEGRRVAHPAGGRARPAVLGSSGSGGTPPARPAARLTGDEEVRGAVEDGGHAKENPTGASAIRVPAPPAGSKAAPSRNGGSAGAAQSAPGGQGSAPLHR